MSNETTLERLSAAIIAGDKDELLAGIEDALRENVSPSVIIEKGMSSGMKEVGERFLGTRSTCLRR